MWQLIIDVKQLQAQLVPGWMIIWGNIGYNEPLKYSLKGQTENSKDNN